MCSGYQWKSQIYTWCNHLLWLFWIILYFGSKKSSFVNRNSTCCLKWLVSEGKTKAYPGMPQTIVEMNWNFQNFHNPYASQDLPADNNTPEMFWPPSKINSVENIFKITDNSAKEVKGCLLFHCLYIVYFVSIYFKTSYHFHHRMCVQIHTLLQMITGTICLGIDVMTLASLPVLVGMIS